MTSSDVEDSTTDQSWSAPMAYLVFQLFILAMLTVGGVSIVIQTLSGRPGPPVLFMVFWFAALGWNLYWFLCRTAYRVEIIGGVTLSWQALLGGGSIPVSALEGAGRAFGARYTCRVRASGYRSLIVYTQFRSFDPMLAALHKLNPVIPPRQTRR